MYANQHVQAVRVLGCKLLTAAAGSANYHGALESAAEHVADLGGMVRDLVHCNHAEVDRHQLYDGA